jgi:glycosyltransferase involved in cell wall biosynthesis
MTAGSKQEIDRPAVAFITDKPGSWAFGRVARDLAHGFGELGERFDLIYLKGLDGERIGNSVRVIGLGNVRAWRAVIPLTRYLRAAKPRVTFASPGHLTPAALLAGKLSGQVVVPWEVTFVQRDLPELPARMRALPALQRATYRLTPALAVVSDDVGEHVRNTHKRSDVEILHLRNPIDIDYVLRRADEPSPIQKRGFWLCAVGRLQAQKGYDVLLKALQLRSAELPTDWSLVVIGDGVLKARLEETVLRYGLEGRVQFVGHLENPYAVMRKADIFVHAARWEGCPVALLEALCLGLPIVAADCPGGPGEILGHGRFGWLVPVEDPARLADALVGLSRSKETRRELSQRAMERSYAYSSAAVARSALDVAAEIRRSLGSGVP